MRQAEHQGALFPGWWLPKKPLAAVSKTGPYQHMRRSKALELPYIESNPLVMRSLVITDRDAAGADWQADLSGLPEPSYVALNPHTTAGHIVYALKDPVCLTDAGRRRPVNLLARIEHGMNAVLGGDASYGGRITKNPLNAEHITLWGEALYGLHDLAKALDEIKALPSTGNPRKTVTTSAIGRNVSLFDITRKWSYRAIAGYWTASMEEWERAVFTHAHEVNETIIANDFTCGPLAYPEVRSVARSIARWTRRNFSPEAFNEIQAARGRKQSKEDRARAASNLARTLNEQRRTKRANEFAAWAEGLGSENP